MDDWRYAFTAEIQLSVGSTSRWHYVALPQALSDQLHILARGHQSRRRGWGAIRVQATIGPLSWQTSIFPAFDSQRYALFLKAEVRQSLHLAVGQTVAVSLNILWA